jgi:hypothetical protein
MIYCKRLEIELQKLLAALTSKVLANSASAWSILERIEESTTEEAELRGFGRVVA